MFFLLFGLLGLGAAGGGGGSSSASASTLLSPDPDSIVDTENEILLEDLEDPDSGMFDEHAGDDDHGMSDDHGMHDDDGMGDDHGMHDDDGMSDDHGMHDDDGMSDDHGMHDDDGMSDDHGMHDDDGMSDDHAGHDDDGGHVHVEIALPTTQDEIDAFVAAVRAAPEGHSHDHGSAMANEHMAAMDLVPRDEATHIAIGNGDWDDPANWHNGEVPGDNAKVLIPEGVHMTYDHVGEARLFTVRVDGALEFATDVDSQMIVDTMVISPSGSLEIGTAHNPVDPNVNVDIIFANNGPIDTDWDPMLLSRGMIAHGKVEIYGTEKDSHDKVISDPMAGDTWVDMGETPQGWAVGDTIVIAGTEYEGYPEWDASAGYIPPQDEIRVITQIEDGLIFFEEPLEYDHAAPRDDLKTSVANYTRNVSFETEDPHLAEVYERGHVMFMHTDDVDVRYAEFHELGRTDKSGDARNVSEFDSIEFDSNVKGRYAFHFHRSGVEEQDDPAMAVGNSVFGSPGWGFVHHDSHAVLDNNASYNTFGAGYVAESGNETGEWTDNIAIFAQGVGWKPPKFTSDVDMFDMARGGDGFWFQGRMVASSDNVAASVNNGFVYFHRGDFGDSKLIKFDAATSDLEKALYYDDDIAPDDHPILEFSNNETFAARSGLHVVKANPNQGHDVHSVLDGFTAWNVDRGAELEYTSHYTLKDFDIIGNEEGGHTGILFGANISDIAIVDATVENFGTGILLFKNFTDPDWEAEEDHEYTIVNPTFIDVGNELGNYDPAEDTVLNTWELPNYTPDLILDGPLTFKSGNTWVDPDVGIVELSGTKRDSLGETEFEAGTDNYNVTFQDTKATLKEQGYYSTSSGDNYFVLDIYFSDRLTGDIYLEKHPVFLDDNVNVDVPWDYHFGGTPYNGVQDFGVEGDETSDVAELWATLTDGELVIQEQFLEDPEEDLVLVD